MKSISSWDRAAAALGCSFGLVGAVLAQGHVTALCSTDQGWCEEAAKEFQAQTGIKVCRSTRPPARRWRRCVPRAKT